MGTIFVLSTTITYALSAIITRRLRTTESSATMGYYSTLVYLIAALIITIAAWRLCGSFIASSIESKFPA